MLAAALRPIYAAASAEAALAALDAFEAGEWGRKFPTVALRLAAGLGPGDPRSSPFPPEIRRVIYHYQRDRERERAGAPRSSKHVASFPTDDAANKLIWLALRNITAGWSNAAHNWKEAIEPVRDPLRRPFQTPAG